MVDVITALGGIKTAVEIAKELLGFRQKGAISGEAGEHVVQLVSALMTAQAAQADLAQAKRDLEDEVKRMKDWNAEKARYQLAEAGGNKVLVYTIKEEIRGTEPPHYICATCYQRGEKSILQPDARMPGRDEFLVCTTCGSDLLINGDRRAEHGKVSRRR